MKRKKDRFYWQRRREELGLIRTKSPKEVWKKLDTKRKGMTFDFNKNEFYEYFKKLSGSQNTEYENISDGSTSTEQDEESCPLDQEIFDTLNRVILTEEVKRVVTNLRSDKAAGLDNSRVAH